MIDASLKNSSTFNFPPFSTRDSQGPFRRISFATCFWNIFRDFRSRLSALPSALRTFGERFSQPLFLLLLRLAIFAISILDLVQSREVIMPYDMMTYHSQLNETFENSLHNR